MTQPAMDGFEAARYQLGHPSCLTSVARRPGVAAARVAEVDGEGGCVEVHVGSHPSVVFILSLEDRVIQETNLLGRPVREPYLADTHVVIPAGQETWWRTSAGAGPLVHAHFRSEYFEGISRLNLARIDEPRFAERSGLVAALGRAVSFAVERADVDVLLLDHLFAALSVALFGVEKPPPGRKGGLAPWQVRRCLEYMEANLARDLGLDELAELVGLSRFHFARSFKQSTGRPPHAQLRALRAERAKGLLHASSLPIGDVAAAVGYETHQAFSRMFVDVVGVTPSQYRSARAARGAASPASPEPTAAPGPGEDQEVP